MTPRSPRPRKPWPTYRTVWRWHFYAGLFCIPFVVFLSLTGSIYLFRPQVDAWLDRPYAHLGGAQAAPPSRTVEAVLAANPGWTLHAYQIPASGHAAAQVLIGRGGVERRVYVDRSDLRILKSVPEEQRFMRVIFHLHGELLQGDRGSMAVELAASWAIVMIVTGLYLWWPRQVISLRGVLWPRFGGGRRLFWRDLHAVTGVWIALLALFMLASGLPWAKNWGGYLKSVRRLAGVASAHQDWTTGRSSEIAEHRAQDAAGAMAGMADMPGMAGAGATAGRASAASLAALDRVAPVVAGLDLPPPVLVSPPTRPGGAWSGRSDTQDRPLRVEVKVDPATGAVLKRTGFAQRDLIDRIVAVGVAAHEGQLFGWANQALGLLLAASLVALSVSAVVLWLRRRDEGVLGAPVPDGEPRFSWVLAASVAGLAVLLPEFAASLVLVLVAERVVLRRIPPVAAWLGLAAPSVGGG